MKSSEYVISFLESIGVKDIFLLSGGGMMHLLDSIGKSSKIKYYCNLNEQATTICTDAYAQLTNDLAVCMVTTGPGGTNAITGITASWLDSEPVLVISGQVKTADLVGTKNVRQIGPQEVNIVEIVKPVTKYAITVLNKDDLRYHLEKACYLATHGRRGPVWVDIPLDIQGSQIEPASLRGFLPELEGYGEVSIPSNNDIDRIIELLGKSIRPVFLVGHGVLASKAENDMRTLASKMRVPVLSTWRAKMVFAEDDELYFGHPGSPGPRYSNYILQTADLVIIIGTRLNVGVTAFNERNFAPRAKKVIVDIDANEIAKLDMEFAEKIVSDAGTFINILSNKIATVKLPGWQNWISYCRRVKSQFPIVKEKQATNLVHTNMYEFGSRLSSLSNPSDIVVTASSGRSCGIMNLSFKRAEGQQMVGSMALGSMGFSLPAAIGACIASGKRRTLVLEGDGSLQHNLQELMLLKTYSLPIKLFVLNNGGYASIVTMQNNHFKGNMVACDSNSGVTTPALKDIANLYNIPYYRILADSQMDEVLGRVMNDDEPVLCEVVGDTVFDEIPKAVSRIADDGSITSSSLEDLFPFLPQEETSYWIQQALQIQE